LTVATPFLVQRLMKYARCVKGCYATLSAKRARKQELLRSLQLGWGD